MPTQAYFDQYPSFPDDVHTAELQRVSFAKLLSHDAAEAKALFEACRAWGFIALDLEGCEEGQSFIQMAADMFELDKEVNSMDVEELMKYAYKPPYSLFGYKEAGNLKIEDGRPDRVEFYNVGRDDVVGVSAPLSNPPCIERSRPAIKSYVEQAHSIVRLICATLDSELHLPSGTLESLQPLDKPSGTALRLLRYLPQPTTDRRTSLSDTRTLDRSPFYPTSPANWRYVKPAPGCAIVNLGDAMVEWSAGILRRNMHRVTFAPGAQGQVPRYSHAYLVRPQAEAPMKRLGGGNSLIPELEQGEEENVMNAKEWEAHKAVAIRQGRDNARSRGGREIKLKGEKIAAQVSEVRA
ncbi:putative oxidoreductase [Hypoxylon sp. NC1633]|nr:putative oxidoreductase [Hypoxylon sp. NC1633]